jgi:hypothetical protein
LYAKGKVAHHAMKTYGGVDVFVCSIFYWVTDWDIHHWKIVLDRNFSLKITAENTPKTFNLIYIHVWILPDVIVGTLS